MSRAALLLSLTVWSCASGGAAPEGEPPPLEEPIRVLLLGDSISIGYTDAVRRILGQRAVVVRPMTADGSRPENCQGTNNSVLHVDRWLALEGGGWDVIHFNFGLHDLKRVDADSGRNSNDPNDPHQAPPERYEEQLRRIVTALQARGARLVFATTTPVPAGGVRPYRAPEDPLLYNRIARRVMADHHVPVDDLYAFALPRLADIQQPLNVHFTEVGSEALARRVAASILEVAGLGGERDDSDAPTWISLFNGRDLDGWRVKIKGHELDDNYKDTFRVEGGLLRVVYDDYERFGGKFGHLFFETPFSHYRLRVEYRFVGDQSPGGPGWAFRNSGVMLHCQSPESMGVGQDFPVSIEAQMLGGGRDGTRTTANLCTPGTHVVMNGELVRRHCTNSTSRTYHGDRWVTMELEVRGNEVIRHLMEGQVVLEYRQPQLDDGDRDAQRLMAAGSDGMLRGGYISLQAESHPLDFRRVELLPLDE